MKHALDLTKYWERRTHGDITAFYTWLYTGEDYEPALVLVPTYRQHHEKTTPCVVPLRNAWKWDEYLGDPAGCARTCYQFADFLGLNQLSAMTCQRIASIIRDGLGDLVSIPPKPTERKVVADAIITDHNGRQRHAEVLDNV